MFGFHFPVSREIAFNRVPQNEDCESLSSEPKDIENLHFPSRSSFTSWVYPAILSFVALATAAFLGAYFGGRVFLDTNALCIGRISKYSPLLNDVDISFTTQRFNGSLMFENIYRQPGSLEVDAAWEALGVNYRAAIVPTSLAARSGLVESQVQVSPKYGGGFPANVEGLHHLHCLNLVRQSLYFNFDYYSERKMGAFSNDAGVLHVHVTHCLDIIRQQLMCTVDVGVLGQVWWDKNEPTAYPDFNTEHTCRNFENVRKWAEEHQAPLEVPDDYLLPPKSLDDVYETMP